MTSRTRREHLYEVFADPSRDADAKLRRGLEIGTEHLGLSVGFLTQIEDGVQEVLYATGGHDHIRPGMTCPLRKAYCRRTVERDSPLAIQHVTGSIVDRGVVERVGLETYIGTTIPVSGTTYGTICFADDDPREEPFSEAEELFLELLAKLIGGELERREHERELEVRNERLEREKRRFEGIAETSFDVLFRIGLDTRFTYVSSAVERVLGYPPAALVGESFVEVLVDSAIEAATDAYTRVLDGRSVENLKFAFLDRAGERVVLEINATPIRDDGEVVGVQGVGRDVTAREERQRELHITTVAMDEARIGISIADVRRPDDPLVYINRGFERITGYAADEVLGRNCRLLQGEETDPETTDQLRRAIDAREPAEVELINYRADGTPFWNRVRLTPIEEAGEVSHYVGFQEDITEQKRTEQLIRLLNRVLRHNLRNDMNALLGWEALFDPESADDTAGSIRELARELVAISERARELERHAHRDRTPTRLDPEVLLAGIVETHRERFPDATIEYSVRTDRGICAGAELERAIGELVENAIEHGPDEPRVEIDVADDGEWIALSVTDDGPGIDEMESKIVSLGTETPLEHSSGLGLWLVNWIVTRYGGSFRIAADDASGTRATFRLPGIDPGTPVEAVARRPTVLSW